MQVAVDERQQRDRGEDNVRHEGLDHITEAIGDSGIMA
jgi:hypothetical protein